MGQKGSKVVVAESCLKPHHAHKCSDVDLKKLRAFIKTGKLAPCFEPYEGEDWRSREVRIKLKALSGLLVLLVFYGFTPSATSFLFRPPPAIMSLGQYHVRWKPS